MAAAKKEVAAANEEFIVQAAAMREMKIQLDAAEPEMDEKQVKVQRQEAFFKKTSFIYLTIIWINYLQMRKWPVLHW